MAKKIKIAESRARYFTRKIASEKGWNINHPSKGGDFLEEQEISSYLPDTGLGMSRPDFLLCLNGSPVIVIETKNEIKKNNSAIEQAIRYCNAINEHGKYNVKIAIGIAG